MDMVESVSSGLGVWMCVCVYAVLVSGETPGPSAGFLFEPTLKTEELRRKVCLHVTGVQESTFPVHSRASHQAWRSASD